jgi:opacity protein-like surface antigen
MNKYVRRIAACTALAGLPLVSQAADEMFPTGDASRRGWFLAAGVGGLDYHQQEFSKGPLNYGYLQGGWRFNRYFSIDARVGTNLVSVTDEFQFDFGAPVPVNLRVQSLYGVYARAILPVGAHWDVYALAGYTGVTLKADTDIAAATDTTNSVSYGIGASWELGPRSAIELEYLPSMTSGDGWHASAVNLGFRLRF